MTSPVNLTFKVGLVRKNNSDNHWLKNKIDHFSKQWEKINRKVFERIEKVCGIDFTIEARNKGISLYLYKNNKAGISTEIKASRPLKISFFIHKNTTWKSVVEVLVEILILSLIYQKRYFNFQVKEPTLFECILADELVASIVGCIVLKKKQTKKVINQVLNNAINKTIEFLNEKESRNKLIGSLIEFSKDYKNKLKEKKSDILKERRTLVLNLLIDLPEILEKN